MPPKGGIHPAPDAFIHAMPAYVPRTRAAGMKWVSAFPSNGVRGLPNISGLLILNADTGFPLAVMDARFLTAQRTGAASALSARYLARPDAEALGILGYGLQSRSHMEALRVLFPLQRLIAYDRHFERAEAFANEMRGQYALDAVAVREARLAVVDVDLVVTAGAISKKPHATIQAGWLQRGSSAALVDFDSYWSEEAPRGSGQILYRRHRAHRGL